MNYLVTGTLGTGKTAAVVSWMENNHNGMFTHDVEMDGKIVAIKRPIYVYEIRGLDHQHFGSVGRTYDDLDYDLPLHEQVPAGDMGDPNSFGATVIIDEAHNCFPVRASAAKTSALVESFAMVRQYNINVILITQHPSSIDKFIRDRLAIHYHLERQQVGTKLYEFYRCETDLSRYAISKAVGVSYSPDKKIFKYYKSAASHAKVKKRLHWSLYLAIPIIILLLSFFGYIIAKASGMLDSNPDQTISNEQTELDRQMSSNAIGANNATQSSVITTNNAANNATSQNLKPEDYVPTIPEQPWSKPLYNNVRQVKSFEYPVGYKISKSKCTAYSEQGTELNIPQKDCFRWQKDGLFNPYREPVRLHEVAPKQQDNKQDNKQGQSNSILSLTDSTNHDAMRPSTRLDAQ